MYSSPHIAATSSKVVPEKLKGQYSESGCSQQANQWLLQCYQSLFQIYNVGLVKKISNFRYFHSVIFLYSQISCLQNTAVSSVSVSTELLLIIHNKDDKQDVQQSPVTCKTETLHEVRFKIVYLQTVSKE